MRLSVLGFCLAAFSLWACDNRGSNESACEARDDYAASDTVCCESYGTGSDGATCCYDFEWTLASACVAAEDMDGGGKQVVVDSCCAGS
jgi:hypothetical protein